MGVETLAFASIAASLAGAGISAYSMYQQGQAQQDMAEYNAKVAENQAKHEADVSRENATRQREMNRRQISAIRARMAGSGVSLSQGSSLDVIGAAASELELATLDLFREGEARQVTYRNQAGIERWQGEQAATAGKIGAIGSLIGGVASTGQSLYSMRYTGTI
jgi:hypothetical protein